MGSASVFILLGRTSEITSPKNKYAQEEKRFYLFFGEFIDLFLLLSWGGVTSGG